MRFLLSLVILALGTTAFAEVTIGKPAPNFTLKDTTGKEHSLSDFKGKIVVLEWTNYGCPFVRKHYGSGNMQKLQKAATSKGVVWLTICSSAPEKQGYMPPAEAREVSSKMGATGSAYLIDESGKVGKLYEAKRTPEMYVINQEGVLVYHGAIDDQKSPDPADIPKAKNYIATAIKEIMEGKAVSTPKTEAYGCSIKYAD